MVDWTRLGAMIAPRRRSRHRSLVASRFAAVHAVFALGAALAAFGGVMRTYLSVYRARLRDAALALIVVILGGTAACSGPGGELPDRLPLQFRQAMFRPRYVILFCDGC